MSHDAPQETDPGDDFRAQLFVRIGAVTVAGGHVEFAMRRLLSVLTGGTAFSPMAEIPVHWDALEKRLQSASSTDPQDGQGLRLGEVLDWAKRKKIKERRNHVIHGAWWNDPNSSPGLSRFQRGEQPVSIFFSFEALESVAERLWEYARRLNDLVEQGTTGP